MAFASTTLRASAAANRAPAAAAAAAAGHRRVSNAAAAAPRASPVLPRTRPLSPQGQQVALPGRGSIKRFSSDTGAENDDKLVGERGEVLQGHQEKPTMGGSGMGSEEKRAEMPAQGGAPEGDLAAAGQETQLTGQPASGAQPEAGDKMPDDQDGKDASQVASEEVSKQEDRAPLQD